MVYGLGVVYATDNMPRRDVAVNHHMYLLQCCSHVNDVRSSPRSGPSLGPWDVSRLVGLGGGWRGQG